MLCHISRNIARCTWLFPLEDSLQQKHLTGAPLLRLKQLQAPEPSDPEELLTITRVRVGAVPFLPQGHTHRTCTHSHTPRHTNTCAPYMLTHPPTHTPRHTNTCAPYMLTHPHTHTLRHTNTCVPYMLTHTHTPNTLTRVHPTCSHTHTHTH